MDAEVEERVRRPCSIPPEDERLAEQIDGERLARHQVAGVGDGMPARAERGSMTGHGG
jgi:hypothetical protein